MLEIKTHCACSQVSLGKKKTKRAFLTNRQTNVSLIIIYVRACEKGKQDAQYFASIVSPTCLSSVVIRSHFYQSTINHAFVVDLLYSPVQTNNSHRLLSILHYKHKDYTTRKESYKRLILCGGLLTYRSPNQRLRVVLNT